MWRWWGLWLVLGCDGGTAAGGPEGPGSDAARADAARPAPDGALDGALDAALDAGGDARPGDGGRDAAADAEADAEVDGRLPDAASDAEADAAPDACTPMCDDRSCGDDGCGGVCGLCPEGAPLCEAGRCLAPDPVIIAEVVAANAEGLQDGAGRRPDWIELQNRGRTPADLTGWFLTDDLDDRRKWRFPQVILAPGEARVVFASGGALVDSPPGELHTSFRLQAASEPLALVWRDGAHIVDRYDPLPPLRDDVAYGVSQAVETVPLVAPGDEAAWWVPAGPLPGWTDPGFDDSAWARGPSGLGFDRLGGPPPPERQVELAAGRPVRQSSTLGGFVAELAVNGRFDDFTHTVSDDLAATWAVDLEATWWIDRISLHNRSSCCGSRLRDVTVRVLDEGGQVVFTSPLLNPENLLGSPAQIEVAVGGVQGRTIEVARTPDPDLSGSGGQGNADEPTVLSLGEVQVFGGGDRLSAFIGTDVGAALAGGRSLFVRHTFQAEDPATFSTLRLTLQTDAGFVAWLNGVPVAAVRAPAEPTWDAQALAEAEPVETVELDLSGFLDLIQPGDNVLAIQGLSADADDLLVRATLTAQRIEDGARRFFPVPTPGAPNDQPGVAGFVEPVLFDVPAGLIAEPVVVSLRTATPEAEIRYTTDGRAPGPEVGEIYQESLVIDRTTTLRAMAWRPDYQDAPRTAATYVLPADVARQDFAATLAAGFPAMWGNTAPDYGMDPRVIDPDPQRFADALAALPTLALATEVEGLFGPQGIYTRSDQSGPEWEVAASAELVAPGEPGFQVGCGLRIQGGAFRSHDLTRKHSLRLLFKKQYGPGKLNYPLFGEAGPDAFETVTLRANSNDGWQWSGAGSRPLYIRDAFARATRRAMGGVASQGRFVHVYINGIYWGVYEAVERPDAAFAATHFGGERADWDAVNSGSAVDGDLVSWNELLGAEGLADDARYRALGGEGAPQLIDPVSYADYMLTNLYVGNTDWPHKNYYAARDRVRAVGFLFFMWDAEWSMGIRSELDTDRTGVSEGAARPWSALKQNAEFRLLVADRAHRHLFGGGALYVDPEAPAWDPAQPERNLPAARFVALAEQVERGLVAESARWGDQHAGTPYTVDAHWVPERDRLLASYLPQRSAVFLDQLRRAGLYPPLRGPLFAQRTGAVAPGFVLAVDAVGERLYYTLDGTDPRLPGGAVAPTALEGVPGAPIVLPGPGVVQARAWAADGWSPLETGTYEAAP